MNELIEIGPDYWVLGHRIRSVEIVKLESGKYGVRVRLDTYQGPLDFWQFTYETYSEARTHVSGLALRFAQPLTALAMPKFKVDV